MYSEREIQLRKRNTWQKKCFAIKGFLILGSDTLVAVFNCKHSAPKNIMGNRPTQFKQQRLIFTEKIEEGSK